MPLIVPISDPADPRLADYANLQDRQLAALARGEAPGLFMAEGELVVKELLRSRLATRSVLLTPQRLESMRGHLAQLQPDTPVYLADQPVLNHVVGFNIHRGVLAAGVRPDPANLDGLLARARTLVILEDLANHDNVGGIFRATAALAGLSSAAILLSPGCADPLYRKAIRVSMGAALHLPFARLDPWPGSLSRVRAAGFQLIALTPSPDAVALRDLVPPPRAALLLGAEGPGLSDGAMATADLKVRIPIDPAVDSLNVTVAGAIALAALAPAAGQPGN